MRAATSVILDTEESELITAVIEWLPIAYHDETEADAANHRAARTALQWVTDREPHPKADFTRAEEVLVTLHEACVKQSDLQWWNDRFTSVPEAADTALVNNKDLVADAMVEERVRQADAVSAALGVVRQALIVASTPLVRVKTPVV